MPTPPALISRAELARMAGVTRAAVTKRCKSTLADAVEGNRIRLDAESVRAFLKEHNAEPPAPVELHAKAEPSPDVGSYGDLTLRELTQRYGGNRGLRDWLDAAKKVEDVRHKRLENETLEGGLISRELVRVHVFGALDAGNRRLLQDTPKTLARRVYAAAKSGATLEEAEQMVRDIISSQLQPVKAAAERALRKPR